jgi:hypothetical protein
MRDLRLARPLQRQRQRLLAHRQPRDAIAQHRIEAAMPPPHRLVQRLAARCADVRDAVALILQQPLGDLPASARRADHLVVGHAHIGEEGLAEGRRARDQPDRPALDAGRLGIDQDEGDAAML